VNTQTTYIGPYHIVITTTGSTDPLYAALSPTLVPIDTAVSTPPLDHVWKCGMTGLEGMLALAIVAVWRRRRR
jgi:hypothetical protein